MVKTGNIETDNLFRELAGCGFDIGNDKIINKDFARGKDSGRTPLGWIVNKQEKENEKLTKHQKEKLEKEKRIANYAAQWAANPDDNSDGAFEYDVDNFRLNNKQIAFVGAAIRAGWIDGEELKEELF